MPDREKVIKDFEDAVRKAHGEGWDFVDLLTEDGFKILSLLKEQEAVEPTFIQDKAGIFTWACGSCGAYMYHIYEGIDKAKEYAKFCRKCGRAVKWND